MNSLKYIARAAAVAFLVAFAAPLIGGIGSLLGAATAHADVVNSITVQGNQRIEASTIRNYITIKPGVSFGPADKDESLKALYSTGLFLDVDIDQRGSTLVVIVVENQIVNSVIFQGNKKIKSNVLVTLVDTKTRGVLTEPQLQADAQRIKDYYDHSGRSQATVETQVTQLPNNRVDVLFLIREGGRTGVKTISFVGNQAYSDSRLRRVIATRQSSWLSWLNRKDVYDDARIQADEELLRRYYMRNGYADFRVLSVDTTFDDEKGKYHVVFTVEEGIRYRFGEVTIDSSIPDIDVNRLYRLVSIKKGRVFDATQVERTIENLTIELTGHGYAFVEVQPRGDRDYTNATISITLLIDEGPRVYVERIEIFGNTKTRDYVIRREFVFAEGDAYNRVLLDRAERKLRALGFFKTVTVTTQRGSLPDLIVIVVTVVEESTGSFSVGGGYSTSDGFIAEISLSEKNFLGRGQALRISYGLGEDDNTYSLSFTDPRFLGYNFSAGFDAYYRTSDASSNRPYSSEEYGGGLRLGLPITEDLGLSLFYKLSSKDISGTTSAPWYTDGTTLTSLLGYSATYSTIDNVLDPSNGIYVKFVQEFAGAGGDVAYVRSVADARYYHELLYDTDIVGFIRVHGGNITGLGQDVLIEDNFFKGGETIRGFAPYGIGARSNGVACGAGCTSDGTSLGGKNYVAATAEVQFPIPFMPPDFGLRGAVFADAGTLFGIDDPPTTSSANYNDDASIRSSVGGSLLWASPFGLLRADFAYALTKESYDETQVFRFSAGTKF
jgi:outer membrane protein insertion porin family